MSMLSTKNRTANTQEGAAAGHGVCHHPSERRPFGKLPHLGGSSDLATASGYFNPTFDSACFGGYARVNSQFSAIKDRLKSYSDGSSVHTRGADVGASLVGRQPEIAFKSSRTSAWKAVGKTSQ